MNHNLKILMALMAAAAVHGDPAQAQRYGGSWETQWGISGARPLMGNGHSIVAHPDLDGDGIADIVVSAPWDDTMTHIDNGTVSAYSGATGSWLWTHHGRSDNELRGYSMALAGDWNADGLEDIAVGSPFYDPIPLVDTGLIKILDAVTGVDVQTFRGVNSGDFLGVSLAGDFDFDGDGFKDFIAGAPGVDIGGTDSGRTYLYSSATAGVVNTFDGLAAWDFSGFSVGWAGDVDSDGQGDFLIGAPNAAPGGVALAGQAMVITSGLTTVYNLHSGLTVDGHLGHAVSGGHDIDGDGVGDYVISAPAADPAGMIDAGVVRAYSGATGVQIYRLRGDQPSAKLGISINLMKDINADAIADLAVGGLNPGMEGFLQLHDGPSGSRFQRQNGSHPNAEYGCEMEWIGDLNGDGSPEFAVGARGEDPPVFVASGRVHILEFESCLTSTVSTISALLGGSVDFNMDFPSREAGQAYALLGSATGTGPYFYSGVAIPLTNDFLFNKFATGSPPSEFTSVYGILDVNGNATASAELLPGTGVSLVGKTFLFSAVSLDAGATARIASVAVSLTITP